MNEELASSICDMVHIPENYSLFLRSPFSEKKNCSLNIVLF